MKSDPNFNILLKSVGLIIYKLLAESLRMFCYARAATNESINRALHPGCGATEQPVSRSSAVGRVHNEDSQLVEVRYFVSQVLPCSLEIEIPQQKLGDTSPQHTASARTRFARQGRCADTAMQHPATVCDRTEECFAAATAATGPIQNNQTF